MLVLAVMVHMLKYAPMGMIPSSTTSLRSPVLWRPPCSSASPSGNGPDSRCDGWAQALAMQGKGFALRRRSRANAPH